MSENEGIREGEPPFTLPSIELPSSDRPKRDEPSTREAIGGCLVMLYLLIAITHFVYFVVWDGPWIPRQVIGELVMEWFFKAVVSLIWPLYWIKRLLSMRID